MINLTRGRWRFSSGDVHATLLQSLPETAGEVEPAWAQPHFSYRFTGDVPVAQYEELRMFDEGDRL